MKFPAIEKYCCTAPAMPGWTHVPQHTGTHRIATDGHTYIVGERWDGDSTRSPAQAVLDGLNDSGVSAPIEIPSHDAKRLLGALTAKGLDMHLTLNSGRIAMLNAARFEGYGTLLANPSPDLPKGWSVALPVWKRVLAWFPGLSQVRAHRTAGLTDDLQPLVLATSRDTWRGAERFAVVMPVRL